MGEAAALHLDLKSDPAGLPEARSDVRAWLGARGWADAQIDELVLALDEALTNVIRHGYDNRPNERICIDAHPVADRDEGEGVEIRVRDFGNQVPPESICGRDLEDVRPGGLGVHIIQAMNNHVEYQCAEGGGMLLIMRKYKTHRASPPPKRSEPS